MRLAGVTVSGDLLLADRALGPLCLDDLLGRSRALQDAACGISQGRLGMGNSRRSRPAAPSQGGSQGSVPAGVGHRGIRSSRGQSLLEMYPEEGDLTRPLQVSIRVAAYQYGEYCELTVCSHHDSGSCQSPKN
jgi:hypothetical protein